ncbi:MAG: hydroxyacylglutathione hydrolase [Pseudomonadota bacterium]
MTAPLSLFKPVPIPAYSDNYIWVLAVSDDAVIVVDPGEAQPVRDFLLASEKKLEAILVTHHHFDHVGGVEELKHEHRCLVHGPSNPQLTFLDKHHREGDVLELGPYTFEILEVPGHTLDHIAYFCGGEQPLLLCGDTLFAGGCGRIFEGDAAMMHDSLSKLVRLPQHSLVCCAHEYTLSNLAFARAADPSNVALETRESSAQEIRADNQPTVPSTLALELATNPFLRCSEQAIKDGLAAANLDPGASEVETFTALRAWKDSF